MFQKIIYSHGISFKPNCFKSKYDTNLKKDNSNVDKDKCSKASKWILEYQVSCV